MVIGTVILPLYLSEYYLITLSPIKDNRVVRYQMSLKIKSISVRAKLNAFNSKDKERLFELGDSTAAPADI